jgi:hypothetical protein
LLALGRNGTIPFSTSVGDAANSPLLIEGACEIFFTTASICPNHELSEVFLGMEALRTPMRSATARPRESKRSIDPSKDGAARALVNKEVRNEVIRARHYCIAFEVSLAVFR